MIEYQGQKQIKTLEEHGKQLQNKKQPGNNDQVLLSKGREIFKNIYNKRLDKIDESSKKLNYGDLKFIVDSANLETDFSELKDPVVSVYSTKKRKIRIEEARYKQEEFNRYLKEIWIRNKSVKQKETLANINETFNRRKDALKFVDDSDSIILEVKRKTAGEEPETEPSKAKTKPRICIDEQI